MLNFTDQALSTIRSALAARDSRTAGLRIGVVGSPCSGLRYLIRVEDNPTSDDQVFESQGLVLFIDNESTSHLQGVQVDFVEQDGRKGFTFDNPNQNSGCSGCSKSTAA
ncbi:HesB/IscA family protein [Aestuariirhabdus sp. LZHN29]|uniref:HesB/IscA family protein n=1 Tax=Aestuariirhabdus sp. LZHN29 TaxID=3417462 RepID=UPI003CF2D3D4